MLQPPVWFDLGLAKQDLRDHAGAAAAYRRVLAIKPDDAEAAFNLGVVLQETGDLDGHARLSDRLSPATRNVRHDRDGADLGAARQDLDRGKRATAPTRSADRGRRAAKLLAIDAGPGQNVAHRLGIGRPMLGIERFDLKPRLDAGNRKTLRDRRALRQDAGKIGRPSRSREN